MKKIVLAIVVGIVAAVSVVKSSQAQGSQPKQVSASVEIMPNYVWHVLASSNVWDKPDNPYGDRWGYTIPAADRRFMYDNRGLVAWGNSRGGMLAGGLFFVPLQSKTTIGDYISFLEEAGASVPDSLSAITSRMTRIMRDNYPAFEKEVWPSLERQLLEAKEMIEARFTLTDPIGRWERNLGAQFPGAGKELVLSYPNWINNLPSANDLGPRRNNFGIIPDPGAIEYVYQLVLHEIGIFIIMPVIEKLQSDPSLQTDLLREGNIVYVAFETFAEKRKNDIFGGEKSTFLPQWEKEYKWFYDYYQKNDSPDTDIESLLRNAIAQYTITL